MSSANRVVKNTSILYAKMAITVFFSLYTTRLILVALGVNDFGIFNLVAGAISMLTFLNTAMASATQRFISYAEGSGDFTRVRKIFNISTVLHIVIALCVLILLEIVGFFLFNGILNIPENRISVAKVIFQFMIVSTIFTIISVPYDAVINAHENMLLFAVIGIIESILKFVIAIYISYTVLDKLTMYVALIASLSILLLIFRRVYCHRKYPECKLNFKKYYDKSISKEIVSFAGWSFLGASSSMLANYGQGLVMNVFFGSVVNAAQGIANQVSGQLGVFAGTMLKALNPVIDKSEGSGNRGLMLKATITGSKVSFFLLMLFFVPVLVEMPYVFKVWLKNVPDYAIIFCRLLLIRNLVEQLFVTLTSSIAAVGNIKRFQLYNSALAFLPLIISYLLFQYGFEPYYLYVSFLIYSILTSVLTFYFAHELCGLSITGYLYNVIFKCGVVFLLVIFAAFLPTLFMQQGPFRLTVVFFASFVAYSFAVWNIGLLEDERKSIIVMGKSALVKVVSRLSKK